MERRAFVQGAGLGSLAGMVSASVASPAHAKGLVHWRLASNVPRSQDIAWRGAESLSRRVLAMSGGRFRIDVLGSDETRAFPAVVDAVRSGALDIAHASSTWESSGDEPLAIGAGLSFGLDARRWQAWMLAGGGLTLTRACYAECGLVNHPAGSTGAPMGGWFQRPLTAAQDLQGLRVRASGWTAKVLQQLGALVQPTAADGIVAALQEGQVDAAEFVGPHDDLQLGLHRAASHYAYPSFGAGACNFVFVTSLRTLAALEPEHRAILEAAAWQVHAEVLAGYDLLNPAALRQLVAAGTRLFRLPHDVTQAGLDASQALLAQHAARHAGVGRILDDQRKAAAEMDLWFRFAEAGLDDAMRHRA